MAKDEVPLSLEDLSRKLTKAGWRAHRIERPATGRPFIRTGWITSDHEPVELGIQALDEPAFIELRIPNVAKAPRGRTPEDRRCAALEVIGEESYRSPLAAWSYDPGDGEICLKLGHLVDGGLSSACLRDLLGLLTACFEAGAPRIRAALDGTGVVPTIVAAQAAAAC